MTYNEIEQMFDAFEKKYNNNYSTGQYCHDASFKWGFQEGAEWMQRKMINKVCEWLKSQLNDNVTYEAVGLYGDKVIISEEGLENFRKAMEE